MYFCSWFLLLMVLKFIHVAAYISSFSFYCVVAFYCMTTTCFIYSFSYDEYWYNYEYKSCYKHFKNLFRHFEHIFMNILAICISCL